MISERHEEYASLAALDLLTGPERLEFEAALGCDEELRSRARELADAAACLAFSAPAADPPSDLKSRILRSVEVAETAKSPAARIFSLPNLLPWALAACLAVCAAWIGQLYMADRTENALLRDQGRLAEMDLQAVRNQMEAERIVANEQLRNKERALADAMERLGASNRQVAALNQKIKDSDDLASYKIAALASMAGSTPEALAVAVWCPSMQEGVLAASKLPALPADKDYQLWVIDPEYKDPVDGGVFEVDPGSGTTHVMFKAGKPIKNIAKFAISREPKGGSRAAAGPSGPIILVSQAF